MVTFLIKEDSWQFQYWNPDECQIVPLESGGFGILDHSIQSLIAKADTRQECAAWLCHVSPRYYDPFQDD